MQFSDPLTPIDFVREIVEPGLDLASKPNDVATGGSEVIQHTVLSGLVVAGCYQFHDSLNGVLITRQG